MRGNLIVMFCKDKQDVHILTNLHRTLTDRWES